MVARSFLVALLALYASGALAQAPRPDPELEAVRAALAALQQEQQSVYQQFQMVQGLRAAQGPAVNPLAPYTPPATPPNYDDLVRERERTAARQSEHMAELERLYRRYAELEALKRPLLERLAALAASPR